MDRTDARFVGSRKLFLWRNERIKGWYEVLGSQYPPTITGSVFLTVNPRNPGATLDLVDASGTAFYEEEFGVPSLELEATTDAGTAGFVDVPPGDFNIQFGGWAQDCTPILGWPGNAENRIGFPIRAGFLTILTVFCAAP